MKCPACGQDIEHEIGFDLTFIWKLLADDIAERKKMGDPKYLMPLEDFLKGLSAIAAQPYGFKIVLEKLE